VARSLRELSRRPTHLIVGMLRTKDIAGYLAPLAPRVESAQTVSIPGETATLTAEESASSARAAGIPAVEAASVDAALRRILARGPGARVLICGSLYLAGSVLRDNA
jgi:dihydrofolate synthase / folylpolyglutamate synthase